MASKAELELTLAISAVLQERGFINDGEALGDYLVMAEVSNWTDAGQGKTKYANVIPGDHGLPAHRVLGLIEVCGNLLDFEDE
jgi:hypothetical protein